MIVGFTHAPTLPGHKKVALSTVWWKRDAPPTDILVAVMTEICDPKRPHQMYEEEWDSSKQAELLDKLPLDQGEVYLAPATCDRDEGGASAFRNQIAPYALSKYRFIITTNREAFVNY